VDPLIWLYLAIVLAIAALALAGFFARQVQAADPGNDTMVELMGAIREGAMTFIRREYIRAGRVYRDADRHGGQCQNCRGRPHRWS
jgi:Na+/H+-translocating membrane pyrophosphatase